MSGTLDAAAPGTRAEAVVLDGAGLTAAQIAAVACEGRAVALSEAARERNRAACEAVRALLARGERVYGVSTGVGALREHEVRPGERARQQLRLLRSHAGGAGSPLAPELVRAAMAVRASQLATGGAGVSPELLDALVAALNAGVVPFTREIGSLGTGDLTVLADVALALLGEGHAWSGRRVARAGRVLREAGLAPPRLAERDGIAFLSSNAATTGRAALLAVEVRRLLDCWLNVAALSFEAFDADHVVLDARVHAARPHAGQAAVAARLRELLDDTQAQRRRVGGLVQDPYPFRALPQIDGVALDALEALEQAVEVEANAAVENALVAGGDLLPNGNPHAGALAHALDGLRAGLAQSSALIAARVSAMLDASLTGLPPFLALRPGRDSGALILEYTAHAAAADVRSLVAPVSVQTVSVSRGVESHASLAPIAARRAAEALDGLRILVATELVVTVRALRLAGRRPRAAAPATLYDAASGRLDADLHDRPLAPDVEAARRLVEAWPSAGAR